MSIKRWSVKRDLAQPEIIAAIEAAGFQVWRIGLPVDLLVWRADKGVRLLEVKTPTKSGKRRARSDQQAQDVFIALTGTPVVKTSEEALRALGAIT
jgi:hypothetical protein